MGLAGWFCERDRGRALGQPHRMADAARLLAQDTSEEFVEAGRPFDRRAGLDEAQIAERAARGNLYRHRAEPPPAPFAACGTPTGCGSPAASGGCIVGRGHAPEMICLFSAELNLLIAADQVLPRISPNVSVWPAEPEADPLARLPRLARALSRAARRLPGPALARPAVPRPARADRAADRPPRRAPRRRRSTPARGRPPRST